MIGQRPKPPLALPQGPPDAIPLRDVAGDGRDPDEHAAGIAYRRHAHRHFDPAPVLAAADGLVMVEPVAPLDPAQHVTELVLPLRRDEQAGRLAQGFLRGIPIHALGTRVPARDLSIETPDD